MSLAPTFRRHFRRKFGRTKKLNTYYYCLKHGLSNGIGIARLAAFLFQENVPKVYAICRWHALSDAISDDNFGRMKKTEPLLLLFKAWAFTWYRYCPASTVPL